MSSSTFRFSAVALAIAATVAVASTAQAGGYAGNGCVGKKQSALGKYTKAVTTAWDKNGVDVAGRNDDIATAKGKLDTAWGKEEAKAAKKGASCNESTSTSTEAADAANASATTVSGDTALGGYIGAALKAWGKYIKDPLKDPDKVTLAAGIDAAATDFLVGAAPATIAEAGPLLADLVAKTTTAPNYPDTFQTIQPSVCAAGLCGGTATACTADADCATMKYGKQQLTPSCVDGDPYMYFAKKGTSNNVLMYYQGGGACWDAVSCFTVPGGTCSRTADASDSPALTATGYANYANPANPFHDWNVVFVSYCTCDVHWGEADHQYPLAGTALHRGRVNAAVAEKWAREHFVDPERVFVTGSSAGSYGAIMNAYFLMKNVWPNADFSVLGDAGVGVITKQWLDGYIQNWGVEENFPAEDLNLDADVTNLSLVDLIDGLTIKFPNARFANYDSSFDGGSGSQTNFFQVMRHPQPPGNFLLDWGSYWEAACDWNSCMREFKDENAVRSSNYHYFTGAGSRHTIFGSDKIYQEVKSTEADGTPRTFNSWVQAMIDDTADWVDVDCNNLGGDCNLTNSCQGGGNAGLLCSPHCVGGLNDGTDCANNGQCDSTVCSNASNPDCPGGSCQLDPDTTNAPYNNDDTVTCPGDPCPCGLAAAECFGGLNDGLACASNGDCTGPPNGTCSFVNCPTFTP